MEANFPKKRAIVVGVDKYQDPKIKPLKYCGADARDIAKAFRESLSFDDSDILELTPNSPRKPTRNGIIAEIGEFLSQGIEPEELLVFYFSGHGIRDPRDKEDYLLPMDAALIKPKDTGIGLPYIIEALKDTRCKNIAMFIDACREDFEDDSKGIAGLGEATRAAVQREGIVTFFSCDPTARSFEIDELGHGSFTYCLLEAIQKSEYETVGLMDKYLRSHVPLINQKYRKTVQFPLTEISSAEKIDLPVFYSKIKREKTAAKYDALIGALADLVISGRLKESTLNDIVALTERARVSAVLNSEDASKLDLAERLGMKRILPATFTALWLSMERRQAGTSDPEKPL